MPLIKTPDQRVRVFISSTLAELADERKAAREAIGELHLTPVFFEAGARPHPPRDLYSAYLEQSHLFVGIYWNSYGWVAPGVDISGLEDEYRLCGKARPKLIYVKRSSERQERLKDLLAEIQRSDSVCYQAFTDAAELKRLLANDLSLWVSEMVQNALAPSEAPSAPVAAAPTRRFDLPAPPIGVVGRDADREAVSALLAKPGANPVTVLGAGGTGKTTLATLVAHDVHERFKDGAVFVPLAPVTDHRLVATTIADALGVQDGGKAPLEHTLAEFLADKSLLLVLDNFEQVADASKLVGALVARATGGLRVLVTSRTSLHVRGEHLHHLATLSLPEEERVRPEDLQRYAATELFVERARAANAKLELNQENTDAIVDICRRMDGLPLAIELAAARTRFFQPAALTARIDRALDLVSKGQRDLPERQQTLRAAIDWSYNLLTEETRRVFRQLGVFKRSWTLEAADVILGDGHSIDIEEMTERLLDVSLIKPTLVTHSSEPRFNMLQTVHEYALEALLAAPEGADTSLRYAHYYRQLVLDAEPHLWGDTASAWLDKLEYELQNIRAAFHILAGRGLLADAWSMLPGVVTFWLFRGGISEGAEWFAAAGVDDLSRTFEEIPARVRGRGRAWAGFLYFNLYRFEDGYRLFDDAEADVRAANDNETLAMMRIVGGCYAGFLGRTDASALLEEGERLARKIAVKFPLLAYLTWSYEYYRSQGDLETLSKNLAEGARLANEAGSIFFKVYLFTSRLIMARISDTVDVDQLRTEALALLALCPAKGGKDIRSRAAGAVGLSALLRRRPDEARPWLVQSLDAARESGDPEVLFFAAIMTVTYHALAGHADDARRLLGAIDGFVEAAQYPLVGGAAKEYETALTELTALAAEPKATPAYLEGRRLTLDIVAASALSR